MCKAWDDHAKKVAAQAVKEANQKNEEHNKKLCKAWENHAKKVAAQAVKEATEKNNKVWESHTKKMEILSAIETARRFGITEEAILNDILSRFHLTDEEAVKYMSKDSA